MMWGFLLIILVTSVTKAEISFHLDLLKHKYIRNVNYFDCINIFNSSSMNILLHSNIFVSKNQLWRYPKNILKSHRIGMFLDTNCCNWVNKTNLLDPNIFKYPFVWFIITDDVSSTASALSTYPMDLDSDVTILLKSGGSFLLYEIYNTGSFVNGKLIINSIGYWNTSLHVTNLPRRNLKGVLLKTVVLVTQSLVNETLEQYTHHPKQNTFDSLHKLKSLTLLEYLSVMFNFRYELIRINSWGYLRNGSFDGIVGALQRHEAEIASTPLFFRKDRSMVIDYVAQTWQSRPCFVFRHPKHPKGYLSIYTRPLAITVWYCILAFLVLSSCVLYITFRIMKGVDSDYTPSLAILFVWSAVCQQGMALNTKMMSTKIVVFVTFLFTLTLYQYYNATVVSTLLREMPKNIRTLNDLLLSNLKVGVEDVLYDRDYFKRTTDPIALDLYKKKINNGINNFHPADRGLALVKHGGFAFHVDASAAYFIMRRTFSEREICDVQEVALYPPQNMGAVLRKGSPYRELVAYGLRKMYEGGIMRRLKTIWDEPKPLCVTSPGSNIFAVSLREFSMALILLLFGMITSVLLLFWEIILYKISNKIYIFKYHN